MEATMTERETATRGRQRPLDEIIDELIDVYHEPLKLELEAVHKHVLAAMATHDDSHFDHMTDVAEVFGLLKDELKVHVRTEEETVFPRILSGKPVAADDPIHAMIGDHEAALRMLARLRELTGGYRPPAGAGHALESLWHSLAHLDRELRDHIAIEDQELFPRVLAK